MFEGQTTTELQLPSSQLRDGQYRVVDLRCEPVAPDDVIVERARSPEDAAKVALGIHLVRSGKAKDLQAKVYFVDRNDVMSMVRLYRKSQLNAK
jgi:hypothetical protein